MTNNLNIVIAVVLLALTPGLLVRGATPPQIERDGVTSGWDWSLPPGIKPVDRSGVVVSNPEHLDVPGHRLAHVYSSWRELEPEEGVYHFNLLRKKIEEAARGCDGVRLSLQGSFYQMRQFTDSTCTKISRTVPGAVPEWVMQKYHVDTTEARPKSDVSKPFQMVNADIFNPDFNRCYLRFVEALGRSGIPQMPQIKYAYVHEMSASRGEEEAQFDTPAKLAIGRQRIDAWARAFAGIEYKLAIVDNDGPDLAYAYSKGLGERCGMVEAYYLHINNPQLGQSVDPQGYLITNESLPVIAEHRAFGDENEAYGRNAMSRWGPLDTQPIRYRESMLRVLEMRRNYIWTTQTPPDLAMLGWVSLELGRDVSNAPDAWCELRESYMRVDRKHARPVKNFERWLYQRDINGVTTEPAIKFERPWRNWTNEGRLPENKFLDYLARRGSRIGFAVDDRFLSGGPHHVRSK